MATGQTIVYKAFERMKSSLSTADVRMFSDTNLADIWQEARAIEKEQGTRRELLYMKRIEGCLQSLADYADVLEVFCQGYPPMAFVWVRTILLLEISEESADP